MLGGDVLFDGVLVRVNNVETPAVGRIAEKFGDRITEDITVMPTSFGRLGIQFDDFHIAAWDRCFIDGAAERRDVVPALDHFSRRCKHVALHPAERPERTDDVENPKHTNYSL